jgi:hypothetical protein
MRRHVVSDRVVQRGIVRHSRVLQWLLLIALAGALAMLAGCTLSSTASVANTPTASSSPTATPTLGPTATPAPTPVIITDLGTFRQKFNAAFTSGKWASVQPLLSPNFSFEPPFQTAQKTGSSHLLPPDSLTNLKTSLQGGNPWSPGSDNDLNNHTCYTGNTPINQVIGFDGNNGHYIMFGIERWQGYWVVAWGFEDTEGGWYTCIGPE